MAKKKENQAADASRPLRIFVTEEEHYSIRVAAAMRDVSMAEFARRVVVDEAKRLTADVPRPKDK